MALLLGAMCESINLPYRYVLAGKCNGRIDRWIEGTPLKDGVWSHIYLIIGYPPFRPSQWVYAEPTLQNAKLGWDIVQSKKGVTLPELGDPSQLADNMYKKSIIQTVSEGLHPHKLLPTIVIAAVTSVLVAELSTFLRAKLREIRKRNS
jgi:hypothetical protein